MSIDAVAVLNIPGLIGSLNALGTRPPIRHLGDASLVSTMVKFYNQQADEHALDLRHMLGSALDAHDDPRGILFFPDTGWPKSEGYEAIVAEMSEVAYGRRKSKRTISRRDIPRLMVTGTISCLDR